MSLLPVAEAQARLLAMAEQLAAIDLPLAQARGRWLAADLIALRDQPWADLSAMDGYAIRHADLPGPWTVSREVAAGNLPGDAPLRSGEAVRIFTGAPMPPGGDVVVLQEDVERDADILRLTGEGPEAAGRHIRHRASDFAAGARLLAAGTRLGPPQLALAALAGHGRLSVRPGARVAVLSTGDELVSPGSPCPPGRLPASNGTLLRAMVQGAGAEIVSEDLVPDELPALTKAIADATGQADVIVTSGGASVGDHDLVRPALEAAGGSIDFGRIAMRPGKPLIVGRAGAALFLGLPGNPVSAMVTGALFLLPLLRHLAGAPQPLPQPRLLPLARPLPATGKRAEYLRAQVRDGLAIPLASHDSAAMWGTAMADALIIRPASASAVKAGEPVAILDWSALGLDG